jgi:hypothetical protein
MMQPRPGLHLGKVPLDGLTLRFRSQPGDPGFILLPCPGCPLVREREGVIVMEPFVGQSLVDRSIENGEKLVAQFALGVGLAIA